MRSDRTCSQTSPNWRLCELTRIDEQKQLIYQVKELVAFSKQIHSNPKLVNGQSFKQFNSEYQKITARVSSLFQQFNEFHATLTQKLEEAHKNMSKIAVLRAQVSNYEAKRSEIIKSDFEQITSNFLKISDMFFAPIVVSELARASVATTIQESVVLDEQMENQDRNGQPADNEVSVKKMLLTSLIFGFMLLTLLFMYLFVFHVEKRAQIAQNTLVPE